MTNLETRPAEVVCEGGAGASVQVIRPRDVPLGGPRAMSVRRTLPSKERSLIGAWCFLDHYGPDHVAATGGMEVPPHPHTGLQTVSWLFTGEVEHRDSAGNVAMVRPGEVNLMTGGRGISHSENTPAGGPATLHGAQLWVALPEHARDTAPAFAHHRPDVVKGTGWQVRVLLGSLLGETSPVETFTPLLGAEILLQPGVILDLPIDATFEHGILVDTGSVVLGCDHGGSTRIAKDELAYTPPGSTTLVLEAHERVRLLLLGGPPFGESIVMWWNFVGRTHEEIVGFREEWQHQITRGGTEVVADSQQVADGRFGVVEGNHQRPIPAPHLPNARLRSRR